MSYIGDWILQELLPSRVEVKESTLIDENEESLGFLVGPANRKHMEIFGERKPERGSGLGKPHIFSGLCLEISKPYRVEMAFSCFS